LAALNGTGWWVFPYLFSSNKRKNTYDFAILILHFAVYRERPPKTCPTEWNEPPELLATITSTIQNLDPGYGRMANHAFTLQQTVSVWNITKWTLDVDITNEYLRKINNNFPNVYFISWNSYALGKLKYKRLKIIVMKESLKKTLII